MKRINIFHRFIIAGFLLLCLTLIYYQIFQHGSYQQLSQSNRIRILPQSAPRGRILDTNGQILAGNSVSYNLLIMPQDGSCPTEQISRLSSVLSVPTEELLSKYSNEYVAPFIPVTLKKDISLSHAISVGQLKYELPEVIIQAEPKRTYPQAETTSHILGYLNKIDAWRFNRLKEYGYKIQDLVGYTGVEEFYDYFLRSNEGGMQVEVDSKGRLSRTLGFKDAQQGRDIELTVDLRIQKIIYNNLKGHTGCVIVLNPDNGEVLALVSSPAFDPQIFQDGSPASLSGLLNDPDAPLFNRAISGEFPPGSIFKIVVAAAGLERGKIDVHTQFLCTGKKQIGNRKFSCWNSHGQKDIVAALAHSCNVFFYNLGLRLGPQLMNEYALRFGFNQTTGIDLSAESRGFLPHSVWQRIRRYRRWFAGDTANLSIGQGELLVTPLQITRIMAAIANGGRLIKPRLLKSISSERQHINSAPSQAVKLHITKETLKIIKKGLQGAVEYPGGTANVLANIGVSVAGKTGTAQVSSGQPHGWFAGYFPTDKPRFVICVFLEHGTSGYYCCQIARGIIEQMIKEGLV